MALAIKGVGNEADYSLCYLSGTGCKAISRSRGRSDAIDRSGLALEKMVPETLVIFVSNHFVQF